MRELARLDPVRPRDRWTRKLDLIVWPKRGVFGRDWYQRREWDEDKHPRVPAGSPDGGQFGSGGGGGSGQGELWPGKFPKSRDKKKVGGVEDFRKDKIEVNSNKTDKFIESWNDAVGMDPGEFHEKFTGGLKSTMEISHRYHEHSSDGAVMTNQLRIDGKLLDENDRQIGTYTREIDLKNNKAESSYFTLTSGTQGKGEGKQMLAANVAMYQELGLDKVEVHANIDVGGYAWAKYGYVPTEDSWDTLRGTLREKLDEGGGSSGYMPEEWDAMSSDNQDTVEQHWRENARDDIVQSEEENWRESGQALEAAKVDTAEKFNPESQWANNAVDKWRSEREADAPPAPSNKEILESVSVDYRGRGEGRDDPDIRIDEGALKGVPEHDLNTLEAALIESFNGKAEDKAGDMDPPDDLADDALDSIWEEMRNRDKFSYAEDNGLLEKVDDDGSGNYEGPPLPDLSDDDKFDLAALLDSDDPKAIWALADARGGKELLLGSDWQGEINFKDKDTMTRFNAYVGKAKPSAAKAAA